MVSVTHTPKENAAPGMGVTVLFLSAIVVGALMGLSNSSLSQDLSQNIDATLLLMIGLLFFEVRLRALAVAFSNLRFIALAWGANFLVVPVIGYAIASLFLSGQPLFYTGLLIYFLAPCTDWFLGFTRMAHGDTVLGTALMPINMLTQLLLFPAWLWLFTQHTSVVDFATIPNTFLQWFLMPFVLAQVARWVLVTALPASAFERVCNVVAFLIPLATAAVILQIFAANISTIIGHLQVFGVVLVAIFVFFLLTYALSEALSKLFRLRYPEHALLAMTTAARNAPLMLALTAIAIPDQPLVYAALVIGTLVEFPHLTALKQVLLNKQSKSKASEAIGSG
ncbi:MAG: arsenic resistance protein [Pseudomonadota bacterium]